MIKKVCVASGALMMIGACASGAGKARSSDAPATVDLASSESGVKGLQPIGDAQLPAKECGMMLWTLEGNRPAAVFQYVAGKNARINIAGKPVELTRTKFDGASGFGVFERQVFTSSDGVKVEVSSRFGLSFNGGAYLEQGLIKVSDQAGWSLVSPTAGIAGCRN